MTTIKFDYIIFISILFRGLKCEVQPINETVSQLLTIYGNYVIESRELDKLHRDILKRWDEDFQNQLVNVTAQYRLDMMRERDIVGVFIKNNTRWNKCVTSLKSKLDDAGKSYYDDETKCLNAANVEEGKDAVLQLSKEIRKWRKTYKYLRNQCAVNNLGDEAAAGVCLVEYMQNDDYLITFQRLHFLKFKSLSDLHLRMSASIKNCENCLRQTFLNYSNCMRRISEAIHDCYTN